MLRSAAGEVHMDELLNALMAAIREQLGIEPLLLPQTANTSTEHIELTFNDITENGENSESIFLNAVYRSGGTHQKWCVETAKTKRALTAVELNPLVLSVKGKTLKAFWKRQRAPYLEYPDDTSSSMPVSYVAPYTVQIDYPAALITD